MYKPLENPVYKNVNNVEGDNWASYALIIQGYTGFMHSLKIAKCCMCRDIKNTTCGGFLKNQFNLFTAPTTKTTLIKI